MKIRPIDSNRPRHRAPAFLWKACGLLLLPLVAALAAPSASAYTVPNSTDLLFGVNTDGQAASGNAIAWPRADSAGGSFSLIGAPTVDNVGAAPVKWVKSLYPGSTGFSGGTQAASIPISGATIVTVIKPVRSSDSGNWRSIVDVLYDQFCLTIQNNTGRLGMRRLGVANTAVAATAIPDGQTTVVSVVMQVNGTYQIYANGVSIYSNTTAVTMPAFYKSSLNTWGLCRNTFDTWSTYNGNLGDVYVWKVALTDASRNALEADLMAKFHAGASYPAQTIAASTSGGGGTLAPTGTVSVSYEADQAFTITKNYGYLADVVVDGVSQGDISSYTFNDVAVSSHTIVVNYSALATRTISGTVTAAAGGGATVAVKSTASSLPGQQTTTDGSGNYTMSVPVGAYYICASQTGHMISADTVSNATGDETINFSLGIKPHLNGVARNIPQMENLLFAADSNDMGAVGTSGNWPLLYNTFPVIPALTQLTAITTPLVTKVRGIKYDNNSRADGDGYRLNTTSQNASIPVNGVSIVALVKPTRSATYAGDGYNSLVDVFYSNLILGVKTNTGQIQVRRNGTDYWSTNDAAHTIPDGQTTILSLVLAADGTFTVWASAWDNVAKTFGTPTVMLTSAVVSAFTAFVPAQAGTDDYRKWVNVGRNNPDGWSVDNGYIGDVFVYKTALSSTDRATLEADLGVKMNSIATYTITASAAANGSISPAGDTAVGETDNLTYTITPAFGYDIADVLVDTVSQGAVSTYTFTNVAATHTIAASFALKATHEVTGRVTDGVNPLAGATIYISNTANASVAPLYTATTDGSGAYSVNVFSNSWYVCASAAGFSTSADITVTVAGAPVGNPDIALAASGNYIPQMSNLFFALYGTALTANGATTNAWPFEHPKGLSAARINTPAITTVDSVQWEKNTYATGDGYTIGTYPNPIATTGVTATAVVQPNNIGNPAGEPRGELIDVFYGELWMAVSHRVENDGEVIVCWRPYSAHNTGYIIPNGQKTILSLVVQPNGDMVLYANGEKKWSASSGVDYTMLTQYGGFNAVSVGRNNYDGWSAFSGNIGAALLWKTALSVTERRALEAQLGSTFGIPIKHTITASTGANGMITPSGSVSVTEGNSQAFTITANSGFVVGDVLVDGISIGATASYTFNNVLDDHTIAATFISPFANWATSKGLDGTPGKEAGAGDDPDHDGRTNLQEFAFNGNPLSGTDNGQVHLFTKDVNSDSLSELVLTIAVRDSATAFAGTPSPSLSVDGITYTIEGSRDLGSFLIEVEEVATPVTDGLPAAGTGYQYHSFRLQGSVGSPATGFIRAMVTMP
ncbi:MAG: carboxypeptidase-like regulatory domain-containing protein [Verrucomicrobiota bacterium]